MSNIRDTVDWKHIYAMYLLMAVYFVIASVCNCILIFVESICLTKQHRNLIYESFI